MKSTGEGWREYNLPEGQEPLSKAELIKRKKEAEAEKLKLEGIEKRHPNMDEQLGIDKDTLDQIFD